MAFQKEGHEALGHDESEAEAAADQIDEEAAENRMVLVETALDLGCHSTGKVSLETFVETEEVPS